MCYFVTIGFPSEKKTCLEQAIGRGMAVHPVTNRSVLSKLPDGYETYVLTTGMCSCDLFRARASEESSVQEKTAKLIRRFTNLGWSKAKVNRAVAQVLRHSADNQSSIGLRQDVRDLLAALAEECGEIAVMTHWYNGDIQSEEFTAKQGPQVVPTAVQEGSACSNEDEIVVVKKARRGRKQKLF